MKKFLIKFYKYLPYILANILLGYLLTRQTQNIGITIGLCYLTAVIFGTNYSFHWIYSLSVALLLMLEMVIANYDDSVIHYNDIIFRYLFYGFVALIGNLRGKKFYEYYKKNPQHIMFKNKKLNKKAIIVLRKSITPIFAITRNVIIVIGVVFITFKTNALYANYKLYQKIYDPMIDDKVIGLKKVDEFYNWGGRGFMGKPNRDSISKNYEYDKSKSDKENIDYLERLAINNGWKIIQKYKDKQNLDAFYAKKDDKNLSISFYEFKQGCIYIHLYGDDIYY